MLELAQFVNIIHISAVGYVFSAVLLEPDMILAKYGDWLHTLPRWAGKPLGACAQCFTGQLALWVYVVTYLQPLRVASWLGLLVFVAWAIVGVLILQKLLK